MKRRRRDAMTELYKSGRARFAAQDRCAKRPGGHRWGEWFRESVRRVQHERVLRIRYCLDCRKRQSEFIP